MGVVYSVHCSTGFGATRVRIMTIVRHVWLKTRHTTPMADTPFQIRPVCSVMTGYYHMVHLQMDNMYMVRLTCKENAVQSTTKKVIITISHMTIKCYPLH